MVMKQATLVVASILLLACASQSFGQLFRGSEAPGQLAFKRLIDDPRLAEWTQPVQIVIPDGGQVSYLNGGSYSPVNSVTESLLGLRVGPVYRLKIDTDFRGKSLTVYPTIEMVDRLYPPTGLGTRHPLKIVLEPEELERASLGNMVTKVVYLENPLTALPFRQTLDHMETLDLGNSNDPYLAADRLGRPMALIRIGSRVPDLNDGSNYHEAPSLIPAFDGVAGGEELITNNPECNCNTCLSGQGCCIQQYWRMPPGRRDEFVCDGNDRDFRAVPNPDWTVDGLDIEDTIAHFDTLDGQIRVTPSNRVCIYAPRFAAVRRMLTPNYETVAQKLGVMNLKTNVRFSKRAEPSSAAHQNVQLQSNKLTQRPNQFVDRTRGVLADSVTRLFGTRHAFKPFEDLQLIRFGEHSATENARLSLALQSAITWNSDVSAQISINKIQPIIVNDVNSALEVVSIESEGDANLRLCKLASAASAKPGDTVDFTIRFDNIGRETIGNVTIIDNLSPRLEYLEDTAECSVRALFKTMTNKAGSLTLRWEIEAPLPKKEGGIIRFQCRVR